MQLACTVEGSAAQSLLFIAGFVGSRRSWNEEFRSLAREFRVVTIDTLGFGESPKPDIAYTVEEHVGAIHDTLLAHGIERTHVVGHSMGCLLGLAYANYFPAQVDKLALLALPYFESEAQARATIRNSSSFNRWLAMDRPLARVMCAVMCTLRPLLQPLAPHLVRDVPDVVAKDALDHNWHSYSRTLRNVIFRGEPQQWLAGSRHELLLIHGTRDRTAPIDNVRPLTCKPGVRLLSLDADHGLIFSHSAWIAQQLEAFFAADAAGGRSTQLQTSAP